MKQGRISYDKIDLGGITKVAGTNGTFKVEEVDKEEAPRSY